ncbi:DHH family phosphoesterase [Sulfurovum riftiae]|uniref:Phosphoesterase n=1 Tax=Sulfurovum riftiae TaxID=1630136 RepID=A0A151CFU2_9BACT|nr:DHH family phosphoesterase [Sulfurovum riftiae]KYJ86349.1 phosphoesterase [Sulfurovum riftiae]
MAKDALFPYDEVKALIEGAESITILSHLNPDPDAIGTALGIYTLLKEQKRRRVEVVNASKALPRHLDFLFGYEKIKIGIEYENSLIIACDSGSIERLGFDLSGREILNIDHHQSNDLYGSLNVVIPKYASSSQVAFDLFKKIYDISAQSAESWYAALLSDTRYFTTSSVNAAVFESAKELVGLGVDPAKVATHFTQRRSLSSFRILQRALGSLQLYSDARIAALYVTKEDIAATGATVPDMDGIVDYARSLATVEVALFAMELEEGIRVSLRSKGADVNAIAACFGGGGHKVAAGITFKEGNLQQIIDTIIAKIQETGLADGKKK